MGLYFAFMCFLLVVLHTTLIDCWWVSHHCHKVQFSPVSVLLCLFMHFAWRKEHALKKEKQTKTNKPQKKTKKTNTQKKHCSYGTWEWVIYCCCWMFIFIKMSFFILLKTAQCRCGPRTNIKWHTWDRFDSCLLVCKAWLVFVHWQCWSSLWSRARLLPWYWMTLVPIISGKKNSLHWPGNAVAVVWFMIEDRSIMTSCFNDSVPQNLWSTLV